MYIQANAVRQSFGITAVLAWMEEFIRQYSMGSLSPTLYTLGVIVGFFLYVNIMRGYMHDMSEVILRGGEYDRCELLTLNPTTWLMFILVANLGINMKEKRVIHIERFIFLCVLYLGVMMYFNKTQGDLSLLLKKLMSLTMVATFIGICLTTLVRDKDVDKRRVRDRNRNRYR